jgi:hypothetical protein
MQIVKGWLSRASGISAMCLLASFLFVSIPAPAQEVSQTTITGTVTSYSKNTLVIRLEGDHYRLFIFNSHTTKPASLTPGTWVKVISYQTEDPEVRLAIHITVTEAPAAGAASTQAPEIVPPPLLSTQSAIEREARKFHFGVQGGFALDPELMDVGIHAKFGPFFTQNVQFRPSVDFAFGEITKLFALNGDVIYSLSSRVARHSVYFGAGPQFNFVEQHIEHGVNFSDFNYSNALNLIVGVRARSGAFVEMKTSVWAQPAPIFRLMAGYTF